MRATMENNLMYSPRVFGARHGYSRYVMTGTFIIPVDGPSMYFLDAGISDRDVFLPPIIPEAGQLIHIANTSSSGQLHVKDNGGVEVLIVPPQRMGLFASYVSGTPAWFGVTTAAGAAASLAPKQRSVTLSPIVIDITDEILNCNISTGAPLCTLPASATRAGEALVFTDVGGNFQTHPLTVMAFAGQTISGSG